MFRRRANPPGPVPTPAAPLRALPRGGFAELARQASARAAGPELLASALAPSASSHPDGVLAIDHDLCIGCGTCVENEKTVFFLDDARGKASVVAQVGDERAIQDAIDACPVACISRS